MDALEALRTRRSVRSYQDKSVARELIESVVDCGRLAASAGNGQPWEFLVVTDATTRRTIARAATYGWHIAEAPVCVIVFCRGSTHYLEDGSAATMNMLLAARAHGLGSCWIAGDKAGYAGRVCEIVDAPSDYRLISLVPMGWPTEDVPTPPKRSLSEVLHWEQFKT